MKELSRQASPGLRPSDDSLAPARPALDGPSPAANSFRHFPSGGSPTPVGEEPVPRDEMLTKEELAAKLRVAVRTIENWQHCGYLPFIKVANVVMFYWPAVLAHLQTHFAGTPGGGHQGGQKAEILKAEN